ncbi:MAG: metal-dependent hydrolase [Lachnospiraceae bacterium]|nr:metal-dependent hydrolase [Lachnospiraceae bacterium]
MSGKTHLAVGIATTFALIHPTNLLDFSIGLSLCAMGSLISDIDSGTSKSHRSANKITGLFLILIGIMWFVESQFHVQIENFFISNENLMLKSVGILFFVGLCAYGRDLPHRSFTHSFLGGILFAGVLAMIFPLRFLPYFLLGFLTHILLDLLNMRKVNLLYPFKKGSVCLGWFQSNGLVNSLLFVCACGVAGIEVYWVIVKLIR